MGNTRRNTKGGKKIRARLTPEEQQVRDQLDLLVSDFDNQCLNLKAESAREARAAADSICTMFKVEVMKLPRETKSMKWEDYCLQPNGHGGTNSVTEAAHDSVMQAVESQVSRLKSGISGKKLTSKKKRVSEIKFSTTRSSSRRKMPKENSYRAPGLKKTPMSTPDNSRPSGSNSSMNRTPFITPKFDISSMGRTVSRTARKGEVLVSLSGSPVAPIVGRKTRPGNEVASNNATIPLGDGNTLNVPIDFSGGPLDVAVDLDVDQMTRLEELHKSLGTMLKIRDQNMTEDGQVE